VGKHWQRLKRFGALAIGGLLVRLVMASARPSSRRKFQAAADAAMVCRKFETSRRREVLSFKHHREVSALPPAEADALLDWSEETRNRRIFDMWMACYSNVEIASREGIDEKAVRDIIGEMADLPKLRRSDLAAAEHAVDFDPPIYNIWKQQEKTRCQSLRGT
jgi:hypothetical protein